jgi:predicted ester cyclase
MRIEHTKIGRILLLGVLSATMVLGLSCQPSVTSGLTQEEAKRILSTYREARNTPNLDLLDQIIDPAVVVHDCGAPADIRGLESLKAFYKWGHAGLPDFKIAFDTVLVSGDNIIDRWTITGTHTGLLHGIPPTGKSVRFSGMGIDRVANGKIVEQWVYFDTVGLLQQLGFSIVPPAPSGT